MTESDCYNAMVEAADRKESKCFKNSLTITNFSYLLNYSIGLSTICNYSRL